MIKEKTTNITYYTTSDGRTFQYKDRAEKHQKELDKVKRIEDREIELLSLNKFPKCCGTCRFASTNDYDMGCQKDEENGIYSRIVYMNNLCEFYKVNKFYPDGISHTGLLKKENI